MSAANPPREPWRTVLARIAHDLNNAATVLVVDLEETKKVCPDLDREDIKNMERTLGRIVVLGRECAHIAKVGRHEG